ncbi:MAG: aminotransferase class V-fold PLP-dependent enzyme [Desulfobacteraceae bacterium]|nr:aminotransferase class V-fold PLP-dependent enzyme [Desulfobacteraceae bacterium]MBC2758005.1 aminotransferase class V-fold PLP-dependent enzyme [Desulfobacteraceae bacterium]
MNDKNQEQNADPFKPYKGRFKSYPNLPKKGRDQEDIFKELSTMSEEENAKWKNGTVSGTFYHAGDEHRVFLNEIFSLFSHVNVIQADLCPSMSKFESEIVAMTASILNGDAVKAVNPEDEVCGTVTSGGTESILMAMKVYRDRSFKEKGIIKPEIIKPKTAHPAFSKAGSYFGIKIIEVPTDLPDFRVDPDVVEAHINENTVAVIGSAGNYPYGLVDPFDRLSELALKYDIGLHADGCLGGFILPWIEKLGYDIPVFDFRLPGLTSISADTHKYGFGLKGTSVVLYRNKALRRYQYFDVPDFPGGIYVSPSSSGSRSGGLTASTWASMVYLGEEGYMKAARAMMTVADAIRNGIETIPELILIGDSTFVISFRSEEIDVFHVNDFMKTKGWRFNVLQLPPALHFCVTMPQTQVPDVAGCLIEDLKSGVAYARSRSGTVAETTALYGMAGSVENNQVVSELLSAYLDHFYTV